MKIYLIRHGITEANEKNLYCGSTDLPLSEKGRRELISLKSQITYPAAEIYITSELLRAKETLSILYEKEPDYTMAQFNEYNFGQFEMQSHQQLKDNISYINWLEDKAPCPNGESKKEFSARIIKGFRTVNALKAADAAIICHGGVIATLMNMLFPNRKMFYQWQPTHGRGYTVNLDTRPITYFEL